MDCAPSFPTARGDRCGNVETQVLVSDDADSLKLASNGICNTTLSPIERAKAVSVHCAEAARRRPVSWPSP